MLFCVIHGGHPGNIARKGCVTLRVSWNWYIPTKRFARWVVAAAAAAAYLHGGHDELGREGLGLALEQQRVPALSKEHLQGLRFGGLAEVE